MDKKIGFVGCGNMGKAILGGLISSGQVQPGSIWVYTPSPDKVEALRQEFGVNPAQSVQEVAQIADIVFGAVKPNVMLKVLGEISSSLNKETVVISIAAGVTLDSLATALGHDRKIIRAMPNTPALVNAGMTSITPNALVNPEDIADALNIFRSFGQGRGGQRSDDPSGRGRQRLFPGLCVYVYRGDGGRRGAGRHAAQSGLSVRSPGGDGLREDGARNR